MDDFGCFDSKKPASDAAPDMRTSYYIGHRHITDTRMGNQVNAKFTAKNCYVRDPLLYEKMRSEYGNSYEWKYKDPDEIRNPALNMKIQFIKPFDECKMRFISRPMKPMLSVSQETYLGEQLEPEAPLTTPHMPTHVASTKLMIDRSKPGFTKYLDPTATTMRLSYVEYTPAELNGCVAAHDNITYWNWDKVFPKSQRVSSKQDEQMCGDVPSDECPKRRCEYQNQLKAVPHSGLTTEVRENYLDPKYRKDYKEYDTTTIKPPLIYTAMVPFATKCESNVYGSGEPTVKYV